MISFFFGKHGYLGHGGKPNASIISKFMQSMTNISKDRYASSRDVSHISSSHMKEYECMKNAHTFNRLKNSHRMYMVTKFTYEALSHTLVSHQQGYVHLVFQRWSNMYKTNKRIRNFIKHMLTKFLIIVIQIWSNYIIGSGN